MDCPLETTKGKPIAIGGGIPCKTTMVPLCPIEPSDHSRNMDDFPLEEVEKHVEARPRFARNHIVGRLSCRVNWALSAGFRPNPLLNILHFPTLFQPLRPQGETANLGASHPKAVQEQGANFKCCNCA